MLILTRPCPPPLYIAYVVLLTGTLAGSTILLLSLAWGFSVILGRCDINERGFAQDKTLTRGWDWFNTGVTVDKDVGQGAAIMAASVLLYGIVQVPAFLGATDSPQVSLTWGVGGSEAWLEWCMCLHSCGRQMDRRWVGWGRGHNDQVQLKRRSGGWGRRLHSKPSTITRESACMLGGGGSYPRW
jgi:hypothetical protein